MNMPTYTTDRLIMRPFTEADVLPFRRMISEPAIMKYIGEGVSSELELDEVIKLMHIAPLGDYKKYGYGRHALVWKESNEVIGFTGLKYLPEMDKVDLGYRMFPEFWGRGIATESCKPMLSFAFDELKINDLIGLALTENKASCRVLEKVGLKYIDDRDYDGQWVSYFELSRTEYS